MNASRHFIQTVQVILIAVIVKTISSALQHEASGESKTEINVIVVLNNSNAESYCQAPPNYTPEDSESAEQDKFTQSSIADSTPFKEYDFTDVERTEKEFKEKVLRELNTSKVYNGTSIFSIDFYLEIREMIMPFLFEKERNVPRYKYTVLFPTKVELNTTFDTSILMTFRTSSKFEHSEIGSADLWFMNGNYNPAFNWFQMTVRKVMPDVLEETYKNIIVEGGEWFNVPVEPIGDPEHLTEEDKWFFISDVNADSEFRIEITCEFCDEVHGPAMKDFNPFIVVKKNFANEYVWKSEIPAPVEVKVNSYCYMPMTFSFYYHKIYWILWPRAVTISYCVGPCDTQSSRHLLPARDCNRRSSLTNSSNVLKNCCAPTKVSSLEIIYLETPNITVYEGIPDLIVEECGCHV